MPLPDRKIRYVGDDWRFDIALKSSDGSPFNLSGYTPSAVLFQSKPNMASVDLTSGNGGLTIVGAPTAGTIRILVRRQYTALIAPLPDDSPLTTTRIVLDLADGNGLQQLTYIIPILPLGERTTNVLQLPEALQVVVGMQGPPGGDGLVVSVNGHSQAHIVLDANDVGAYSKAETDTHLATVEASRQPVDPTLTALAAVATLANKLIYANGLDSFATVDFPLFGRQLVATVSPAAARTLLEAAAIDSAALSGVPTAPTAALGTNTNQIATMAAIQAAIASLIDGAPGALDTIKELADALGDDPNFAATVINALAGKQPLDATLTGLAALALTANDMVYANGNDTFAKMTTAAWGRALLGLADLAAMKALLSLTKGDVGLGNVDNTDDASKPISTAVAAALAAKFNAAGGTIGGNADITGALMTRFSGLALGNGANHDIAIASVAKLRITGPTGAFSIGGLTGGSDGRQVTLLNLTSQTMTILNQAAASTAANRINTLQGADIVLRANATSCVTLCYDATNSRWVVESVN